MVNGIAKFGNYLKWSYLDKKTVLGYLSPDVINQNNFSKNGTYGLGVVYFELINQKHPFIDDFGNTDKAKILRGELPPIKIQCSQG